MLVERTADPSTALGMTKGGGASIQIDCWWGEVQGNETFLLGRPPAVPTRGIGNGAFLDLGRMCNKSPGAPSPRISCKAWWGQRTSCGFPHRKPHTLPWLGPRSRKSGVLRAFREGWDTTNLDTDRSVSHPLQRTQRTPDSCHAALDKTARAPFYKERRMNFAQPSKLNRNPGRWGTPDFVARPLSNIEIALTW